MENAWLAILALGWIDIFNPVAVSIVLVLLPMVRKRWHILIYVVGGYLAYVLAADAIFFGVDRWLADLWFRFTSERPVLAGAILVGCGAAALVGFVIACASIIRAWRQKREMTFEKVLFVKSAAPWFIFLLSFGSTWSCMFSAYAMLAYIGVLVANDISMQSALLLIAVFSLFSLIPPLLIYLLVPRLTGERSVKIVRGIRLVMSGFCLYSIPVVLAVVSWLCLDYGLGWLAG